MLELVAISFGGMGLAVLSFYTARVWRATRRVRELDRIDSATR